MNEDLIECSRLSVNCVPNDPVDIKCGGPLYLGFDFNVKEEETNQYMLFIFQTLKKYNIPIISIEIADKRKLNPQNIWDEEKISREIESYSTFLITESARNYNNPIKKVKKINGLS